MRDHIDHGVKTLTLAKQVDSFIAEGRKSCKGAQNADEQEGARFRGDDCTIFPQVSQKTNHQAANQVDDQGSGGKALSLGPALGGIANKITEDRANKSAGPD